MLLATLHEMRAIRAKQEALAHIQAHHYFDILPEDWDPYPTQTEPRWHTMIAWARKDSVVRELMFDHDENDHWEITRKGLDQFERFRSRFGSGELTVRRCYLWSPTFKRLMYPDYQPSEQDWKRPTDYRHAWLQEYA
jgi:hypothetical protein